MDRKTVRAVVLAVVLCIGYSLLASAIPAVILTNTGERAEGSLTGLDPVLRLVREAGVPFVGPDSLFDVPLSAIRQITLDFPRVIIETATRTLVAPFAAFSGIDDTLKLDVGEKTLTLATAALRAIALNGHSLRDVPREWLRTDFLEEPEVIGVRSLTAADCIGCTIETPTRGSGDSADDRPVWNAITPAISSTEPETSLPWWIALIGVVGLVGLYFLLSTSASS